MDCEIRTVRRKCEGGSSAAWDVREVSGAGNGWFTRKWWKGIQAEGTACVKAQRSDDMVWLEANSAKVP